MSDLTGEFLMHLIALKRIDMNDAIKAARKYLEWSKSEWDDDAMVEHLSKGIKYEEALDIKVKVFEKVGTHSTLLSVNC